MRRVLLRSDPATAVLLVLVVDVLDVRQEPCEVLDHVAGLGMTVRVVIEVVTDVLELDVLLAALLSTVSGLLPALRAARQDPSRALRYE